MLAEFCPARIEKIRHYVPFADAMFEVDEFLGDNTGLVVAELELQSQADEFPRPPWLGLEGQRPAAILQCELASTSLFTLECARTRRRMTLC
jgi:CYTH domain-containing protein